MEDDDDLTTLINPQSVVDTQAGGIPWDALGSFFGWGKHTKKPKNKKNINKNKFQN